MIKLSAVIIAFNEEKNIKSCLDSLQHIADEILVVDSGSTDKTTEICKIYPNLRLEQRPFTDFVDQKNYAMQLASYDYILSLDADEILSEPLRNEIRQSKENWEADAYMFNRLTSLCGTWIKHSGWYPDKILRLWDRRKGRWEGELIHEKVIMQAGSKISPLKGVLFHNSYHNLSQYLRQIIKYAEMAAKAKYQKGEKVWCAGLILNPVFSFIKKYFLKLGFLDGYYGFIIAVLSAYGTFQKYIFLREWHRNKKQ
jgi:glycosyltransferase involved in cell wall biosynthesis